MRKSLYSVFLICSILIFIYLFSNQVTYITDMTNQDNYMVRDLPDKLFAASNLDMIKGKLIALNNSVLNDIKQGLSSNFYLPFCKSIATRLPNCIFSESTPKSSYTSYTVNKGDEMVVCLRSKYSNKIHNMNELMYVTIHEMAHIGCPEKHHTPLFHKINKFLLQEAIDKHYYVYVNYKRDPCEYCGIDLDNTIIDNKVIT